MELNAGHFKYYKCRSLLACDAGGTVYDTSRVCGSNGCSDAGTLQRDAYESEKIVYIVDREKQGEEKRPSVDSTTHLDDDEFNDYEMHSGESREPKSKAVTSVLGQGEMDCFNPEEQRYLSKDLRHYLVQNDDDSDTISVTPKSDLSQDSNTLSDLNSSDSINESKQYISPKERVDVYNQIASDFQYSFVALQSEYEPDSSKDSVRQEASEYDFDPSAKAEVEFKRNVHQRKQKYTVKDDSFAEMIEEDTSAFIKIMCSDLINKKKNTSCNKKNYKSKLQYQKKNPFANVKMSSILKGSTKSSLKKNKNHCKHLRRELSSVSLSNKNIEVDSHNFNEEVIMYRTSYHVNQCSPDSRKEEILQFQVNGIINLNSDLTNADYFDYVQPREQIIESDMDKLLSPTVEVDFSEIFQVCQRNCTIQEKQKQINRTVEKQKPIDCNGNEVDFQDIHKMSNSKSLSPNEVAERELYLKSIYAKKLGYENYFNTSNDSVINDILYDQGFDYKDIQMDTNFINKSIEVYLKQNQFEKSCTLLESLYEFNRFGGFVDENCDENKSCYTEENSNEIVANDTLYNFSEDKFHVEPDSTSAQDVRLQEEKSQSDLTFNFSNKSSLLGVDCQAKYNSDECLSKVKVEIKQPPPLKIKIKRVNDENNEYVIDDSTEQIKVNKKKKSSKKTTIVVKSTKDIDRYECNECSIKFRTKRILQSHMSEYHKGPYDTECEICHMKFRRSSAHKKHESWCEKNVIHKCDTCNKVYCYRASLLKHLKTHTRTSQ